MVLSQLPGSLKLHLAQNLDTGRVHEATESLPGTFHKSFFDTRSNRICADDMEELTPKAARINHRSLIRNTLGKMQIKEKLPYFQ